jgi:L-asparaginase
MSHPIAILSTGGTIDKIYFDAKSEYEVGAPQISGILKAVGVEVPFTTQMVFQKDSLEITDQDRKALLDAVVNTPAERVLITHGTDTMVETASVLAGLPDRTIVLVGSLTPARFKGSDAEFNIGFALAAVQTLPHGVWIAMNGRVFSHNQVRKNRAMNRFEKA